MNRFKALKPGESPDARVNEILEGARNGWWMDTSMFGTIARVPPLLKTILPVFEAFFGGGRIPPMKFVDGGGVNSSSGSPRR